MNPKCVVQCPRCNFVPLGARMRALLPTISRTEHTTVHCAGCLKPFLVLRIADQLFDNAKGDDE